MSDDNKTPERLVAPSVPGKKVQGPADLVVRMNESTSEDWDMVPLPARQQLGWHEDYERVKGGAEAPELHEMHGVSPQEMLHSPLLAGADQDTSLNLTEAVTYHLEATPPPAEPPGAPGSDGYNRINRGIPPAENFEHPADFTLEQGAGVRTFRLPEGVADSTPDVEGTGPYMPGEPRLAGGHADPRNQSDDTRQRSVQTPSVNDPYRNPDGSLRDPKEVLEAQPDLGELEFGSHVQLGEDEDSDPEPAVETEGLKAEPPDDQPAAAAAEDVPEGSVGKVLEWVGDDPAKARAALEAENAKDEPRATLVAKLNDKV